MHSQGGGEASPLAIPGTHSPGWSTGSYDAGHTDFWARQQWNRNHRRRCSAMALLFWSAGQALMAMYYVLWASLACSRKLPGFILSWFQRLYSFPRVSEAQSHQLKTKRNIFLTVLDVRSLNSRGQLGSALSKGSREGSFLSFSSFWCCPAMLGTP